MKCHNGWDLLENKYKYGKMFIDVTNLGAGNMGAYYTILSIFVYV